MAVNNPDTDQNQTTETKSKKTTTQTGTGKINQDLTQSGMSFDALKGELSQIIVEMKTEVVTMIKNGDSTAQLKYNQIVQIEEKIDLL